MFKRLTWVLFASLLSASVLAGCPGGSSGKSANWDGDAGAWFGAASDDPAAGLEAGCAEICDAEARCGAPFESHDCIDQCVLFQALPTLDLYRDEAAVALWGCTARAIAEAICDPAGAAAASERGRRCSEGFAVGSCRGRSFEDAVKVLCGDEGLATCLPCVGSSAMPLTSERLFRCYHDDAQLHVLECVDAYACEGDPSDPGPAVALALCITDLDAGDDSTECCGPSDPCEWADDDYCDCDGEQAWDAVDCRP
jgi:hypothetical protein